MGFLKRRQSRLVSRTPDAQLGIDKRWVALQGFKWDELPRHATWYYPNGGSGLGPTDPYHLHLYRMRGYTLKAPYVPPKEPPMPVVATKALKLLGRKKQWLGTATDFITATGIKNQSPDRLGRTLFKAEVLKALDRKGVNISRKYQGKSRILIIDKVA